MNKICIIGRLTKDVEIKKTTSGVSTLSNIVAVKRDFKNVNGEYEADFINIVAWRNTAEFLCKYAKKGSLVGLEGRIQTRNYENTEGQKVYVTEMLVEQVELLEKKQEKTNTEIINDVMQDNDPFADFGQAVDINDSFLD